MRNVLPHAARRVGEVDDLRLAEVAVRDLRARGERRVSHERRMREDKENLTHLGVDLDTAVGRDLGTRGDGGRQLTVPRDARGESAEKLLDEDEGGEAGRTRSSGIS